MKNTNKTLLTLAIIFAIAGMFIIAFTALFNNIIWTNSPIKRIPTEHCLDVYSGGRLIWQGKAESDGITSEGSVYFINKITNEQMRVRSDFIYYVCHEEHAEEN